MDEPEDVLQPFYQYLDSDLLKLEIKQTKLPFKGLGLFANATFSKGEIIAEYYGSILTCQQSESDAFNEEDKLLQIDDDICIIGRGPASKINDVVRFDSSSFNTGQYQKWKQDKQFPSHDGFKTNAKLSLDDKQKVFIKSCEEIKAGQEIYMSYGFNYWHYFHQYEFEAKTKLAEGSS